MGFTRKQLEEIAGEHADAFNVDRRLVFSIIKVESDWNQNARGPVGEIGLMQLWPKGAIAAYERTNPPLDYSHPSANTLVGCWFIAQLVKDLKSRKLAASYWNIATAYNGGMSAVIGTPKASTVAYAQKVCKVAGMSPTTPATGSGSLLARGVVAGMVIFALLKCAEALQRVLR